MSILALADDMTGALEVGAQFSAADLTVVAAKPMETAIAPVIVYDTETRHLSPADAAERVRRFVRSAGITHPLFLYKKTDSTLRGNIAAELKAISGLFPDWRVGYVPAYPALGRTVKQGVLYVDGVAVSETSFGSDPLNPVSTSVVHSLFDSQLDCMIFDGEFDCHAEEAARAILRDESMRILAGPGALAGVLANILAAESGAVNSRRVPLPKITTCLVMNGSRHERSVAQMREAQAPGWKMLKTSHAPDEDPAKVADTNARHLLEQISSHDPDAVFIMGGDTAYAVIAALGFPTLWPIREIVPGVPISRIPYTSIRDAMPERNRDLFLITKAGGFGPPDVIQRVHNRVGTYDE